MATTVGTRPFPSIRLLTMTAADTWYELTVPSGCRRVTFRPSTNAARLGFESAAGTDLADGQAYAGTDLAVDLLADIYTETVREPGDRTSYFVMSPTIATVVVAILEG